MGVALFGAVGTAGASSVDLGTLNADPSTGSGGSCGPGCSFFDVFITLDSSFTINSGDDVTVHVHMSPTALTIPAGSQFVGLNFEPRDGGGVSNISVSGTMEFSNGSGGPNGAGPIPSGISGAFSNVWGSSGPAASWTLVDLASIATYTWAGGAPLTFDTISVSYQVTATPLPAALPLFASGLGLLGFLARKRRKANT